MAVEVPSYSEFMYPTLQATFHLGGSGSIGEIVETVVKQESYAEEQQAVLHNDGPGTEIEYRLAWARSYLKAMGLLTNSARGVWALTDEGVGLLTDPTTTDKQRREAVRTLLRAHLAQRRRNRTPSTPDADLGGGSTIGDAAAPDPIDWKEHLLEALMRMAPDAFERLAQRLLREADFDSVNVTGRSGDGGIDRLGVYRLGLVSFPVFFQCKRYRGSVGSAAVRDFRGAMSGRGDKGLLITTGAFSAEAKREATRDGAPPVDLIDGDRLCVLLKRYELGVRTEVRQVEDITIDPSFFVDL